MKQYQELLSFVLENGVEKEDRTGIGTISHFGNIIRFDLSEGFPLVTTKRVNFRACVYETLWFLRGSSDTKYLNEHGIKIWNSWADSTGDLGPVYGHQWRHWASPDGEIDQITKIISEIKTNPDSRRHVVSTWNVADIDKMRLPPCHMIYQFYVNEGRVSCAVNMRSVDLFLGLPFDIVDYALLTKMVAQVTNLVPNELVFFLGDTHIYKNHLDQVRCQLTRIPKTLPKVVLNPEIRNIDDFKYEDFELRGYAPHPAIKAEVAV